MDNSQSRLARGAHVTVPLSLPTVLIVLLLLRQVRPAFSSGSEVGNFRRDFPYAARLT